MANTNLAHFSWTVQDDKGNGVSGAQIEVRKQGAQCKGSQSSQTLNVNSSNAVRIGYTIALNTADGAGQTRACTGVAQATVSYSAPAYSVNDDDRLTIVSDLPTLYEDPQSDTTK